MPTVVAALFEQPGEVDRLLRSLDRRGIPRDRVSVIARDGADAPHPPLVDEGGGVGGTEAKDTYAAQGVGIGGTSGALVGAAVLAAIGLVAVPGAGLLAIGPLSALLTGASFGAVTGGLAGALIGSGIPRQHAETYAQGVQRGMLAVAVHAADDAQARAVASEMAYCGAMNLETHMEEGSPASRP